MVLSYYGGFVKKNNLLDLTKTTIKGTTAYHIKEALKTLGFESKGISCTLEDINKDNIILPCIASVTINESYKHFVVIYEINFNKKYLIIGDPADKVKKISYKEFDKIYNKVIITFFPTKTLPIDKNISSIKFITYLLKSHKTSFLNIFILSLFITLFSILTTFYTEYIINGINFYSTNYLTYIFCIFFSIYILKIISDYFRNKLLVFINTKIDLTLTIDIFNNIIYLPYHYYKNRTTGDIISRINDLNSIRDVISKVALSIFVDLPLTIISLIVLFIINKTLFTVGILILVFYFIIIILFRGVFENYIKKIQRQKSEVTAYMIESINGFETIKGSHIEKSIMNKFEKKYVKYLKKIFNYQNIYFLENLLKQLINDIGFITIILIGGLLVINGKLTIGTLFTFTSLLVYFLEPIKNIIDLDTTIKEAKNSIKRILNLLDVEKSKDGIVKLERVDNIEFKNLNYSFNDRDYILKDINLNIEKNSKIMVVGKSGSGKSTLFKILMKYYNVDNNKVFINGIDINNYTKKSINNKIIYVGQNEILFNDTLYNNLIFDNSDSSKLLDVSKMCYVDEIKDHNLGFNILIEENGFNLSGGEKQRIILARALLRNFDTIIIDEGLSEVDTNMERKILKNIFKYFKDKQIIVISHRLDNLDLFDRLIKIENGVQKDVYRNG